MTKGNTEASKVRWRWVNRQIARWRKWGVLPFDPPTDPEPLTRQVRRARERAFAKASRA